MAAVMSLLEKNISGRSAKLWLWESGVMSISGAVSITSTRKRGSLVRSVLPLPIPKRYLYRLHFLLPPHMRLRLLTRLENHHPAHIRLRRWLIQSSNHLPLVLENHALLHHLSQKHQSVNLLVLMVGTFLRVLNVPIWPTTATWLRDTRAATAMKCPSIALCADSKLAMRIASSGIKTFTCDKSRNNVQKL